MLVAKRDYDIERKRLCKIYKVEFIKVKHIAEGLLLREALPISNGMSKNSIIWLVIAVLLVAGVVWLAKTPGKAGAYDEFAQCVADSGATFYGTFWCPYCDTQKADLGRSARLLPYVECATPDGRGQLRVCQEAGIEAYPTWEFGDGERVAGYVPLEQLSEFTGCSLPNRQ